LFDGALAAVGLLDLKTVLGEALGEHLSQGRFILDEEKMLFIFSHLQSVSILTAQPRIVNPTEGSAPFR